jgi:DNA/RNA endonuclease YhcR with UshA esterase domain
MRNLTIAFFAAALALPAAAHHSFAVFFDPGKTVTLSGKVTQFRFTNPHGTIVLEVARTDGTVEQWRAETNAPVILARRGWTRDSVKPGDEVTITGWPSRDGRPYIRLSELKDAQGNSIGTAPFGRQDQS